MALTGFMGSGKSSVGRALASLIGWNFVDLDVELEKRHQQKIRDVFHLHGEARFRQMEADVLRLVLTEAQRPLVLATGGGTLIQPENARLLRAQGALVVFLEAAAETLLRRCGTGTTGSDEAVRPLARDRDAFLRLYEQRLPFYRTAELTFDSNLGAPDEVAREIAAALRLFPEAR